MIMKKHILIQFFTLALFAAFIVGCKGKKDTALPPDEKEVIVPCSGPDYFTNDKVFRANSLGESSDQRTAGLRALTNARNDLATSISVTVKTVTDNYVNSREFNNKEEILERFESLNREVVNQELSGVRTICERLVRTKEGRYKSYVAIELGSDTLIKAYNERLSTDERLRIDYDYEQFKKTFEAEMDKMR